MATQRGMHRSTRLLVTLAILAVFLMVGGGLLGATFASFNAQTSNPNNTFTNGTLVMTNEVAVPDPQGFANCSTETYNGVCATLFNVPNHFPGAGVTNQIRITYKGTLTTAKFGLYAANFASKDTSSSTFCSAAKPADQINLYVQEDILNQVVYTGKLENFATTYNSTATMLSLHGGSWAPNTSHRYTVSLILDQAADNTYQGCKSKFDLVWYAEPIQP